MDREKIAAAIQRAARVAGSLFLHGLRLLLGGAFIYAGSRKVLDAPAFARDIQNYGLLASANLILLLAIYLPWLELAAGLALIVQRLKLGALLVIAALLFVFTGALTIAWARGLDISCGCFAEERAPGRTRYPELLARDAALLLAAGWLLRREWRNARTEAKVSLPEP